MLINFPESSYLRKSSKQYLHGSTLALKSDKNNVQIFFNKLQEAIFVCV